MVRGRRDRAPPDHDRAPRALPDHEIRLSVAIFLSFLSILLHMTTEPFTDPATNTLALVSHLLVFMVFFVAQQITTGVVQTDKIWAWVPTGHPPARTYRFSWCTA